MKKLIRYSITSALLGGIGYLIYKNTDLESQLIEIRDDLKAKRTKWEMNHKTNAILINAFTEIILENPNIGFDNAILKFENAKEGLTLDQFAETKMRISDSYRKSYRPYYDKALDILNKN